ncbi:MAG: porin family protein [Holosporales bacterium]|jgi:opacity protein-like surface antigen|nr:porin family protein [Holosporales bacterium]
MKKLMLPALLTVGLVAGETNKCFAAEVEEASGQESAASEDNNGFSGFFVGGGAGIDFYSVGVKNEYVSIDFSPKPFGAVLVAGFGQTLENQVYVGGELDIGIKSPSKDEKTVKPKIKNVSVELKTSSKARVFSIGGSLKVGYSFDNAPLLAYGLVGFENYGGTLDVSGPKSAEVSGSGSESFTSFRLGAGCNYKFDDNWSARGDVLYAFKKEKSLNISKVSTKVEAGKFEIRAMALYNFSL